MIRLRPRRHCRSQFRRCPRVRPDPVHFARPDRPAPDVHLKAAFAPQEDARIRVRQGQAQFLALDIPRVSAVRQNVRHVRIHVGCRSNSPVHVQHKIPVFFFAPQVLVSWRLAFRVVIDHPIDDLPVPAVAGRHLPAGEVLPIEQRHKSGRGLVVRRFHRDRASQAESCANAQCPLKCCFHSRFAFVFRILPRGQTRGFAQPE